MKKSDKLPAMFRVEKSGKFKGELLVVFPTVEANYGKVVYYVEVGGHGEGDMIAIHQQTRPATPVEYANLLRNLSGPPYNYNLKVVKRDTALFRKERWER